jgi:Cu2+-containing amine oxidase
MSSGNYDYAFSYYFYQDGSIRVEVQLHGIVNPKVMIGAPTSPGQHGTLLAPGK